MNRPQRLVVDPIKCDAHGICAELLPEVVQVDDWGYPILSSDPVPRGLVGHARRAVSACPTLALHLAEVETPRTSERP